MTGEYQSNDGPVVTTGSDITPEVQYGYTTTSTGQNLLTSMTYPDGSVLNYNYADSIVPDSLEQRHRPAQFPVVGSGGRRRRMSNGTNTRGSARWWSGATRP